MNLKSVKRLTEKYFKVELYGFESFIFWFYFAREGKNLGFVRFRLVMFFFINEKENVTNVFTQL